MTKLDAGLITSLPASDPGSAAVWGSKRINPRPQFCLCLAWSGCPSNDDDDDDDDDRKRNMDLSTVFRVDGPLCYCHNIKSLFEKLGEDHIANEWRLSLDSPKRSLKAVLLHNGIQNRLLQWHTLCF